MKNRLLALSLSFLLITQLATVAQPLPAVPSTVQFADLTVRFDEGARRIIQQDVNTLVLSNRRYWEAKLDRVILYFPIMEAILKEEQVPVDFKYLAVQESSLTPDAVSTSAAVGYWQFKREAAQDFGMRVDDEIDERKHLQTATRSAARYLKRSNTQYNNWVSSLFSYYLGATGISKLVPPEWVGAREISLNSRTDRYILRFFAHKIALESALPTYRPAVPMTLLEYPATGGKTMAAMADELGLDEYEIRKYNRWLQGDVVPTDKEYSLLVPVTADRLADVRQRMRTTVRTQPSTFASNDTGFPVLRKVTYAKGPKDVILYEINGLPGIQALAGDNATSLARKAKISYSSFLRYNDMGERDPVTEGEVYYLAKKMRKAVVPFHTVREGETLRGVSQMYGIRLKHLLKKNRIDRLQKLQAGRILWLRDRRPRNRPVEIVNDPAAPAVPGTTAPSSQPTRPVVAQNEPTSRPAAPASVPQTAADRKKYTPKFADEAPAETNRTASTTTPATRPTSRPANPAPSGTTTSRPTSSATSPVEEELPAPGTSDRVVIIRTTEEPEPSRPAVTSPNRPVSGTYAPSPKTTSSTSASRTPATPAAPTRPTSALTSLSRHTVEPGQTYYSISRQYGVTVDELLAWNKLTMNDKLSVGQQLLVKAPAASTPAATANDVQYHTVQRGETMFRISKQYGVSVEQIQEWNQLSEVGVKEGQRLKIMKGVN